VTVCEEIGRWAADLESEDLPRTVTQRARLQLASMLAARAAGEEAAVAVETVAPQGQIGEIYRSAAASIAHDWDDYLFMGHTGHSAVWTSIAFCSDPERALMAQVAANEVAGRLGAALFLGPHNGQFWASIHCAGAAVAASIGLGLDAERTAHAVAIAMYQPPYGMWPGFMGPGSKLLTAAEPAAQGARAALLAREGMSGALDVIEHPRGVLASMSFAPLPGMLGGLGEVWLTETLAYKPRPGCAYLQAAIDAVLAAEVGAADIAGIEIESGYLTCAMEELSAGDDLSPVRVNFSAALSAAVALIAGRLTHEQLHPAWLADHEDEIRELAARISVHHDLELTLATLRGPMEAGIDLRGLPLGDWLRVGRGLRDTGMDDLQLGWSDLRELGARPELRQALRETLRGAPGGRSGPPTIERLDTSAMRLAFPCRARLRLRSGRVVEVAGEERGACGGSLDEQRAVVDEKCELVGIEVGVV
jgi:2-methylcitrate dehydratase MmgE/PrpD-like protein